MADVFPTIYLARHGETAWSLTGQHTGLTDLQLTEQGERNARRLGERIKPIALPHVFSSPLRRAYRTCELAGLAARAEVDPDLVEWNYGDFEGLTRAEILRAHPGWDLFRDGCPGGESVADVVERADRVVERVRQCDGNAILFSSGHFPRMLAVRWSGLDPASAGRLSLSTASLSGLGYEPTRTHRVIRFWNDTGRFAASP